MLKSLGTKYSDVLVLKLFYDMSDEAIAKKLDITVENARVRIFRGRNQLKQMIKEGLTDD